MTDLDHARAAVDSLLGFARNPMLIAFRRLSLSGAVVAAESAEHIGEEYDTRILSGVLAEALGHARQEHDAERAALYAGKLLAVLSDLADNGDEDAAEGVNACVDMLPVALVQYGAGCAAQRREGWL